MSYFFALDKSVAAIARVRPPIPCASRRAGLRWRSALPLKSGGAAPREGAAMIGPRKRTDNREIIRTGSRSTQKPSTTASPGYTIFGKDGNPRAPTRRILLTINDQ